MTIQQVLLYYRSNEISLKTLASIVNRYFSIRFVISILVVLINIVLKVSTLTITIQLLACTVLTLSEGISSQTLCINLG